MSDDDFMQESDEEQYDFEYEDDDEEEETGDIDMENQYYNAKQLKQTDPTAAIASFLELVDNEPEKNEWGFKGLKQAIKAEWPMGKYTDATEHFSKLLSYTSSPAISRNYSEKSINNMLDYIAKSSNDPRALDVIRKIYRLTLDSFKTTLNERLLLKTNIKYAKLLMGSKSHHAAQIVLDELHQACKKSEESYDPNKGTYAMEVFSLDIQLNSELNNTNHLKYLYEKALTVRSAVSHPKIMGIIRECGGKLFMNEENWSEARINFFESFRSYDEAGSLQRIQVLKYLLLTTMLMQSDINPFDSQETKPYKNDPRILPMTELVDAYQRDDLHAYQAALDKNPDIMEDPFIAQNIEEVTRSMRIKGIRKAVAPYTCMRMSSIANRLKIDVGEVMEIIGFLIITDEIRGYMDETTDMLHMGEKEEEDTTKTVDLINLEQQLNSFVQATAAELSLGRGGLDFMDDSAMAKEGPENKEPLVWV
ncbi:hypothetical protein BROUX41_000896 [Berkeleyomyces rouxiae]|uniref:uncharacterized protein n=1 Tax=Berkeleyomyces rouxiae TaxID=2035830 RepID=UPI003B775AB1